MQRQSWSSQKCHIYIPCLFRGMYGPPPKRPLILHPNGPYTYTTHSPNQIHTAVTQGPLKLAPLLPCDYGERVGRRRWPNSHLADSSEEILGESWWRSAFMPTASDGEPRLPSISWMRSKLFQIIWEREAEATPFYFLDALTMFSVTLLAASKRWALPKISWINWLIDPFTF